MINKQYNFKHFETALIAFIANFEKKINDIVDVPVYMLETGDESYWFKGKFETSKDNVKEIYQKVPRIILTVEEATLQTDQDTNQYIKINYQYTEKIYNAQVRRKAITFPFSCTFVSSNFIKALENFEILLSILSIDNTFTYDFLGNTYSGSYNSTNFSFEKTPTENGGTKNFNIKVSIDVQLQPMIIRFESLTDISDGTELSSVIGLVTKNHDSQQIDYINPDVDCD